MKTGIITSFIILIFSTAYSQQDSGTSRYFEARNKGSQYYVEVNNTRAIVYHVGSIPDKGGSWYTVHSDTLNQNIGSNYSGNNTGLVKEAEDIYLLTGRKVQERLRLTAVNDEGSVRTKLNNAYFFEQFFQMEQGINETYPLNHYSFRNGFVVWQSLQNKNERQLQFRDFVRSYLAELKDSLTTVNEKYVAVTNDLLKSLATIPYQELKENLSQLPADFVSVSKYFSIVVKEIAKQRPEDFFRLAEDMPQSKAVIFYAAEGSKEQVGILKGVKGHDQIKAEFLKERKFNNTMPWKILGGIGLLAGVVVVLVAG
jgi:hypothetical protein